MSCPGIDNLLRQKIGIDVNIIGVRKVYKAVETRCFLCGISNTNEYLQILQNSSQELDELVELIVVPETWFFRDRKTYEAIANYVRYQWLNKSQISKLRLLSIPCSTGEEPYSLAMTLLDLGLQPDQFNIDAVDINKQYLFKAKKGIYGRNSFRGDNLEFQNRYFNPIGKEYQISQQVRNTVNFSQGNLLDSQLLLDRTSNNIAYDIIFCRNVLIYFDVTARKATLKNLDRLLKPEGIMLLGTSETGELGNLGWQLIRVNGVLVGQKKSSNIEEINFPDVYLREKNSKGQEKNQIQQKIQQMNTRVSPQALNKPTQINKEINQEKNPPHKTKEYTFPSKTERNQNHLDCIRNLADEGNLKEALLQCKKYLQVDSTNAEVYVLLGEVYQAQKLELKAEDCFQKAIYLDPENSQALLHLILLKEQRGDNTKANILRQRWQRLQNVQK